MNIKKVFWNDAEGENALLEAVSRGKVVVGTSDTVIGLLSEVGQAAFDKLNKIKSRSEKSYLLLVRDKEKILRYVEMDSTPRLKRLLDVCWPGPVTIIFNAKKNIPAFIKSQENTVAIRVPCHEGLLRLLTHVDALFSTSANKAYSRAPIHMTEVDPIILSQADLIVEDKQQKKSSSVASTILDVTGPQIKVIREGAYPIEELEKIYGEPFIR